MFRWIPTYKGRHLSKFLLPSRISSCFCSTLPNSTPLPTQKFKTKYIDIDFDVLFHSCHDIPSAKRLHALIVVLGKARGIFITTRLVNVYARLGSISFACNVFDRMPNRDVYTWNSMISAYVQTGCFCDALNCFHQLLLGSRIRPDFYTFPPVLKACASLVEGKRIHCWVSKLGFGCDIFVAASLVHMYCRFGILDVARTLFDEMPIRDLPSWNAIISGFCQNGNATEALSVLDEMRLEGIKMDTVTVASILPLCAQMQNLSSGLLIHLYVIKHGLELDVYVCNALINMYGKLGSLGDAAKIFDHMVVRDVVSWNSVIAAYEQNEDPVTAFKYYAEMQLNGFHPDLLTLVSLASIVAQFGACKNGESVHCFIARRCWWMKDVVLGNAIVDMYAKLGDVDSSHKVFEDIPVKDVISWNTLITGYTQNGLSNEAIEVFNAMQECKDIVPNQGTWVSIIPAYSHVGALQQGMRIHGHIIKTCLYLDVFVGTSLIDMYGKCGKLDDATSLFYQVPRITSVPWNAIIACHGIHGHGEKVLNLFREMLAYEVKPDHVTFLSVLSACSHSGLIAQGENFFHMMQEEYGIKPHLKHYGCMVDLLGRGGYFEKAWDFIRNMPCQPDVSIWGALLGACRIHGNVELGKIASACLFELDSENVGYYVLLSNIYANTGKWEGVDKVRSLARNRGLKKTPGWSSVEVSNRVHVFYTGNQSHPQSEEIYKELRDLTAQTRSLGYVPDYSFVLQDVEDDEKENILMSHSERLAIAFAIISTAPKTPIRIFKNLRVCGDCHEVTKYISRITEREIVVRDYNRFHHFRDGICSCGNYW